MKVSTPQELTQRLIDYLLAAESTDDMRKVLRGLLTPSELTVISTRLEIARLIKEGMTQREIAKTLGVGIATVTRASNEIKAGNL